VSYSIAVSKLRRPFLSDRFFFIAVRLLQRRKVGYIPMNPVRAGLAARPQDWRWPSFNEYAGTSAEEQGQHRSLIIDRVRMPADPRTPI